MDKVLQLYKRWHILSERNPILAVSIILGPLLLIGLIIVIVVNTLPNPERDQKLIRFQSIVAQLPTPPYFQTVTPDDQIQIQGKCLLWDVKNNTGFYQGKLPDNLQANPTDPVLTIFLVEISKPLVGHYSKYGASAYSCLAEVSIYYWPQLECIGYKHFENFPPSERLPEFFSGQAECPGKEIVDWIQSLPMAD